MDPSMFVAYSPQVNGVPLESKLATYMVSALVYTVAGSLSFVRDRWMWCFFVVAESTERRSGTGHGQRHQAPGQSVPGVCQENSGGCPPRDSLASSLAGGVY